MLTLQTTGAFLWKNPKKDHWSKIVWITVHQRNRWIRSGKGSWIKITFSDFPKETHPATTQTYDFNMFCQELFEIPYDILSLLRSNVWTEKKKRSCFCFPLSSLYQLVHYLSWSSISCNNISTGFSCLPLDYKTGISHRNPEETLFDYTRHRIFQLSKDRLRKFAASRILYYSNSVATFNVLLTCGDIETNPGPENLPLSITQSTLNSPSDYDIRWTSNDYNVCSSCLVTLYYSFGLLCDTCNVWFHYTCVGLSFDKFIEIIFLEEVWICPHCSSFERQIDLQSANTRLNVTDISQLYHRFLGFLTRV